MNAHELVEQWESAGQEPLTAQEYAIRLPVSVAAKVTALAEVYPQHPIECILRDLIGLALDEVEAALPQSAEGRIVSEDDEGNPIFDQTGRAVRYQACVERLDAELSAQAAQSLTPE